MATSQLTQPARLNPCSTISSELEPSPALPNAVLKPSLSTITISALNDGALQSSTHQSPIPTKLASRPSAAARPFFVSPRGRLLARATPTHADAALREPKNSQARKRARRPALVRHHERCLVHQQQSFAVLVLEFSRRVSP
ncbi:26S proteasome non-ATPase regulatory subunit 3 [Cordyceps militaris]|uniref:26S proteasome non-ATPase regulatory subunit 3 n=1 Tax=Cordyceps militaris TaxID=73501 RepID=A0A2H4SUP5_CORMI|nr:26S proteasome non-ATPase regulatory subunit 3 [Cordyceps militaris]